MLKGTKFAPASSIAVILGQAMASFSCGKSIYFNVFSNSRRELSSRRHPSIKVSVGPCTIRHFQKYFERGTRARHSQRHDNHRHSLKAWTDDSTMVSIVPQRPSAPPASKSQPVKPLLRRATIRKSDDADLDGDILSRPPQSEESESHLQLAGGGVQPKPKSKYEKPGVCERRSAESDRGACAG